MGPWRDVSGVPIEVVYHKFACRIDILTLNCRAVAVIELDRGQGESYGSPPRAIVPAGIRSDSNETRYAACRPAAASSPICIAASVPRPKGQMAAAAS